MREIKFRAWNKKKKQIITEDYAIGVWIGNPKEKPKEIILMQFTNLTDKNGKEIYEGDIVNGKDSWGHFIREIIEYSSNDGLASYTPFHHSTEDEAGIYSENVEVIGNIYENPELIKETE